jgi:TatD DNase family protein
MSESNYIRQRDNTTEHGQTRDLSYPPLPEALTVGVYDNHAHLEIADLRRPQIPVGAGHQSGVVTGSASQEP